MPSIVSGPKAVVVGIDSSGESLTKSAEFTCTAIGRPAPQIEWIYRIISRDTSTDKTKMLNNGSAQVLHIDTSSEPEQNETGRNIVTSRIVISVSQNDGGFIECRTGSENQMAPLTVLGTLYGLAVYIIFDA